jgi:hypothetical protein
VSVAEIATDHSRRQGVLARRVATEIGRLWRVLLDLRDIAASWARLVPRAFGLLSLGQVAAARASDGYVGAVVDEYGLRGAAAGRVVPETFAGVASDGRDLASLLYQPAIHTLQLIGAGVAPERAAASGAVHLDMIARTQVADAGRGADGVAIAAQPELAGYIRMIVGDTCSRCIILAGRWYAWNEGFERHPRCDCRHIPISESVAGDVAVDPDAYFASLSEADQDRVFTRAGAAAIRAGADMARVVNARRGMATAGVTRTRTNAAGQVVNESIRRQVTTRAFGRQVFATTEAAGRRRPRLMPEQIFREAKDRDDAVRLLRLHRYIL